MRMDTPWRWSGPKPTNCPARCKNYFTVQRWVDISNDNLGVTWATLDAPLIEIGAITCDPRDKSVGGSSTSNPRRPSTLT